ncbi:hypothetical protein K469DRAFT_48144 [Zopfia rhizophila CBS 207.26]|uniref:Uncharacterized protein n=1 Tax=Zopfia rhizophila CBS 207.26 TaxID=1314779 RepID=A0A6A6EET9_9PEZI|nr:hypothetical protein K469DRAFT_48144 [Zopfia rhizophila CBS 207.26]
MTSSGADHHHKLFRRLRTRRAESDAEQYTVRTGCKGLSSVTLGLAACALGAQRMQDSRGRDGVSQKRTCGESGRTVWWQAAVEPTTICCEPVVDVVFAGPSRLRFKVLPRRWMVLGEML